MHNGKPLFLAMVSVVFIMCVCVCKLIICVPSCDLM
jgi:hypothetical protein